MCKLKYLLTFFLLFLSVCASAQDMSLDTSEKIVEQVDLGQAVIVRLVKSLNLRESILSENEKILQTRESSLDKRETNLNQIEQSLNERDLYLTNRENLWYQTAQTLQSLQESLSKSEYWHRVKNKAIVALAVSCVVEGAIIYIK